MKILFAFLIFCIFGASLSCTQKPSVPLTSAVREQQQYVCPMHPQVRQETPGKCPICGMNLVKSTIKSAAATTPASHEAHATAPKGHTGFHLTLDREQMIGLKLGRVERRELFKEIRAPGRVAYDPELYTAQAEFIEAIKQMTRIKGSPLADVRHSAERMVESAKLRLKLLGLSDKQIAALAQSEQSEPSLLLQKAGGDAWVYAEIFELDLPHVKPGDEAIISASFLEDQLLTGKIVSIDRVINPATRTAKVRIALPKARLTLRPENYVEVVFHVSLGSQISVPFDAILDSGKETWVFIKRPDGGLEPRRINVKFSAGDWIAIASGVSEGESLVISGNFLVDSESRLKAVALEPAAEPSCPPGQFWHAEMNHCMTKVLEKK